MALNNYWFLIFLSIFVVNPFQTLCMKRSSLISFDAYNKQPAKKDAIHLFDVWIEIAIRMVYTELRKNSKNFFGSGKEDLISGLMLMKSSMEYELLKQIIAECWAYGLNKQYRLSTKDFIETLQLRYQIDPEYLNVIEQQEWYTLEDLLLVIVNMLIYDLQLKISNVECINLIKEIVVPYILQKFLNADDQLSWCECPRVYLGERIILLIMIVEKLSNILKPEDCTAHNPLIYTSFGSGSLLYDYVLMIALSYIGYKHFKVNFIDLYYDEASYSNYRKYAEERLTYQLAFCKGNIEFKFYINNDDYLKDLSNKNDLLLTIDTMHYNDSKLAFKQLIQESVNPSAVIASLSDHKIKFKGNDLLN